MKKDKKIEEICDELRYKIIESFEKDMEEASLMFDESGWTDIIQNWLRQTLLDYRDEVRRETLKALLPIFDVKHKYRIEPHNDFIYGFEECRQQIISTAKEKYNIEL